MMIFDSDGNLVLLDNEDFYKSWGIRRPYNVIRTNTNTAGAFTYVQFERLTSMNDGWEGTYKLLSDGTIEIRPVQALIQAEDGKTYNGYYYSTPIKDGKGDYTGTFLSDIHTTDQQEYQSLSNYKCLTCLYCTQSTD